MILFAESWANVIFVTVEICVEIIRTTANINAEVITIFAYDYDDVKTAILQKFR